MRRPFPRTPGSPQATVTVETPAHRCADALVTDELHFSGVVIGSVEPIMSFVQKNAAKIHNFLQIASTQTAKITSYVIKKVTIQPKVLKKRLSHTSTYTQIT